MLKNIFSYMYSVLGKTRISFFCNRFFFFSCSLRSPLRQQNKFDQKKNVSRVMSKSLYIAYSFHH